MKMPESVSLLSWFWNAFGHLGKSEIEFSCQKEHFLPLSNADVDVHLYHL